MRNVKKWDDWSSRHMRKGYAQGVSSSCIHRE